MIIAVLENGKMDDVIYKQDAIDVVHKAIFDFFDICDDDEESPMTYKDEQLLELNKAITTQIKAVPSADAIEVVRCKDCKHRWVNEHYGEKGYMKIKAMCSLDTDDPFELGRNAYDDNWFCADGERKDE